MILQKKKPFVYKRGLLQIEYEKINMMLDLVWYVEIANNNGSFKILIIENQDWEKTLKIQSSKSQKTITEKLVNILNKMSKAII